MSFVKFGDPSCIGF